MTPKPNPRADKTLSFAPRYKSHLLNGSKTTTVRYNDEKDIQKEDVLKCKADGKPFARVDVANVEIAEVRKVPDLIRRMGERHGADDWKKLRESLNHFYEDDIYATTDVKVIVFRLMDGHGNQLDGIKNRARKAGEIYGEERR